MATQLDWWVVANKPLPAEGIGAQIAGGQTAPAGSKVISTKPGSAEDKAFFGQRDQPSGGKAYNGLFAIFGPFTNKADAVKSLTAPAPGLLNAVPGLTGISAIGGFFNKLSQANLWLRVVEGLLGVILIGVSLAKLTGADNVIASTVTKLPI